MKLRSAILVIALIIIADQFLKIWIKTHYPIGEVAKVIGSGKDYDFRGFKLHFIENPGMAWGMQFGGKWGKLILTLFRFFAVIFGSWYLVKITRERYSTGFIFCAALIYAGALGNLIDSMFYGMIFDKGMVYNALTRRYEDYEGIARATGHGYSSFLHGYVVDMLYFPLVRSHFPSWVPIVGGEEFEFFSAIFNIADASISIGVITLLLFQKRFFRKYTPDTEDRTGYVGTAETSATV